MDIIKCGSNNYKEYLRFVDTVYKDIPSYKNTTHTLLKLFLMGKGKLHKWADVDPVMIIKNNKIVAVCMYIHAHHYKQVLQIAFFEALPNEKEAVEFIISNGVSICKEKGISRIVVGLNGHVNYGLGLLADHFDSPLCFGSEYNPSYYIDYFNKFQSVEYTLTSFKGRMSNFNLDRYEKIVSRVCSNFTFRNIKFSDFKNDIKLYTDLNNKCFKTHPFYFKREYDEDYELFKDLKLFMKEENLIFVEKDGKPIGFLLWYPDYNELIPDGGKIGVTTLIKNKFQPKRIEKFKIVEIGVLPKYHNTGAIVGLFNDCMKRTRNRYKYYETSWIFNMNFKSKSFGVKWADEEYKHYKVYEMLVDKD